jgi:hypothetical protein
VEVVPVDLTRFYEKKPIDSASIRAMRDLLKEKFNWGFSYTNYTIYYPGEFYSVDTILEGLSELKGEESGYF